MYSWSGCPIRIVSHLSLMSHLESLPDPRIDCTKHHELADILPIIICTLLCGGESFYDMEDFGKVKSDWFATFLRLPHGIPSHDTFNRVFSLLDHKRSARPCEFSRALGGGATLAGWPSYPFLSRGAPPT